MLLKIKSTQYELWVELLGEVQLQHLPLVSLRSCQNYFSITLNLSNTDPIIEN